MKRFDCLGFGLATLDQLLLVAEFPQPGRKLEVLERCTVGGGPVATALATLAKLGMQVGFCGRLGDDDAGRAILDSFAAAGVDIMNLSVDSRSVSPVATVLVEQESGRRTVLLERGKGCALRVGEIDVDLIRSARAVHLDGRNLAVDKKAARLARQHEVTTFLDLGSLRNSVDGLLEHIDHLVIAEEFALGVTGRRSLRSAARDLWLPSMQSLTITAGREGVLGFEGTTFYQQPAFDIAVKDVTGAGDAFHGGYIFGVMKNWSLPEILRFAAATAALNCRELGGRAGLPSTAQVRKLIKRGERDV